MSHGLGRLTKAGSKLWTMLHAQVQISLEEESMKCSTQILQLSYSPDICSRPGNFTNAYGPIVNISNSKNKLGPSDHLEWLCHLVRN